MSRPKGQDFERARAYKDVVEALWAGPLFDACEELIPHAADGTILIAEARCGFVPLKMAERTDSAARIIAMDGHDSMLDIARKRLEQAETGRSIFFVDQRVGDISYADDVFHASLCLDGLCTLRQVDDALKELARVTTADGKILLAAPLLASFPEFYDILDEALRAHDLLDDAQPRLERLQQTLCTPARLMRQARLVGLFDIRIDELSWQLAFSGGHEFLQSPLVRETFFSHWLALIRTSDRDPVMRYIGDAIDTYWHGRPFQTTIHAATIHAEVGALTQPGS